MSWRSGRRSAAGRVNGLWAPRRRSSTGAGHRQRRGHHQQGIRGFQTHALQPLPGQERKRHKTWWRETFAELAAEAGLAGAPRERRTRSLQPIGSVRRSSSWCPWSMVVMFSLRQSRRHVRMGIAGPRCASRRGVGPAGAKRSAPPAGKPRHGTPVVRGAEAAYRLAMRGGSSTSNSEVHNGFLEPSARPALQIAT